MPPCAQSLAPSVIERLAITATRRVSARFSATLKPARPLPTIATSKFMSCFSVSFFCCHCDSARERAPISGRGYRVAGLGGKPAKRLTTAGAKNREAGKQKAQLEGGAFFVEQAKKAETRLFDLGFFVLNVLTDDGIELHDRHLFRHVALVLRRGVEVTRTSGRLQLDLVACAFCHDLLLRLHRVHANLRARCRYRSCRSGADRRSKRADAPNGFRFRPRNGGFADSGENDAWSCCSRGKRCCRSSALSQLLGIRVP